MNNINNVIKFFILLFFMLNLSCSGKHEVKVKPLEDMLPCPQNYKKVGPKDIPGWIFNKDKYKKWKEGYVYFVGQSEFVYSAAIAKSMARENLYANVLMEIFGMRPEVSRQEIEFSEQKSDEIYNPTLKKTIKRSYIITSSGKSIIFDTSFDYHLIRCFNDETGKSLYQCWVISGMSKDPNQRLPHPEGLYEKDWDEVKKIEDKLIKKISILINEQAKKNQIIMQNIFSKLSIQGDIIKRGNSFYAKSEKHLNIIKICMKLNDYYKSITFIVKNGDKWSLENCKRDCKVRVQGAPGKQIEFDIARNNNCINNAFNLAVDCDYDKKKKIVSITDPVYKEIFFNYFNLEKIKKMVYSICVNDSRG